MKNFSKLWKESKKHILGGNMLISKRPEMFLPNYWPTYFLKSKDIMIWDLNKKKYKDFIFAVGPSILGYANQKIDKKVKQGISKGNLTTLNCYEEVLLAKKLINLHPWSDQVKFARSGGEANAIAIRVARCSFKDKKDHIAICGYHGWHDWYLSVNLSSKKNLDKHLLPGLNPIGVPKELKNKIHAFEYGDFDNLTKINKKYPLGAIKMEVSRDSNPDINFLKRIREFCNKHNIILIFDECTTGFRSNLGGLHLKTRISPDLAMFGKALGNGYAISAVLGNKRVMKAAEKSFISSTFWTERVGYVAGLATIEYIQKNKAYNKIIRNGKYIKGRWLEIAKKNNLKISVNENNAICSFYFEKNHNLLKTFLTKKMLEKNYLASNMIYVSIYHNKKNVDEYIKKLDKVFKTISKIQYNEKKITSLIKSKGANLAFKRLVK